MFTSAVAPKTFRRAFQPVLFAILAGLGGGAPAAVADDAVLARVGGETVTESEVESLLAGELLKLERQRHEMIRNGVANRVQEILVEREAARRGISKEEILKIEVDDKAASIPAADVDAFYQARRIRQPKEAVEGQIRRFLAYQKLVAALESEAEIEYLTEPFRVDVEARGPSKGDADAPVTIVEFGDFECPPCGQAYPVMKKIRASYGDDVRFVFRHFPLSRLHPNAQKAAEASLCAHDQGKFWELHDRMFENQQNLGVEGLKQMASEIAGLDAAAFDQCLDEGEHAEAVGEDMEYGISVGVSGTPAFFVNGRVVSGAPTYEALAEIIDDELARRKGTSGP